jgi:hypothetical protein
MLSTSLSWQHVSTPRPCIGRTSGIGMFGVTSTDRSNVEPLDQAQHRHADSDVVRSKGFCPYSERFSD